MSPALVEEVSHLEQEAKVSPGKAVQLGQIEDVENARVAGKSRLLLMKK